jgi:hypothetical protein
MARVNIYLPDGLARRAREAGLNVSGIAQASIEQELQVRALDAWLAELRERPPLQGAPMSNEELLEVMDEVREEMGRAGDRYVDPEGEATDLARLDERNP